MDGFQELTPPLTMEETIMAHNQVQDLHEKYCKQESRISKLEASDQFQNKQLEKLIQKMDKSIEIQTKQLAIQEEQANDDNQLFTIKSGVFIAIVGALIVFLIDGVQFIIMNFLKLIWCLDLIFLGMNKIGLWGKTSQIVVEFERKIT